MAKSQSVSAHPDIAPKFLFTDASCLPQRKIAGWAAMLIAGERSWMARDILPNAWNDTTYCEMAAVANALTHFSEMAIFEKGEQLTVYLDNLVAVEILREITVLKKSSPQLRAVFEHIAHLQRTLEISLVYRWVPSHQGLQTHDWRGLINTRVDREARWWARQVADRMEKAPLEDAA